MRLKTTFWWDFDRFFLMIDIQKRILYIYYLDRYTIYMYSGDRYTIWLFVYLYELNGEDV